MTVAELLMIFQLLTISRRHGQHIVLLLNGQRKTVRHSLPLNYSATIASSGMWRGVAIVPIEYLPPNVSRMNAYAIHGTGNKRVYESLFPVPPGTPGPDLYVSSFKVYITTDLPIIFFSKPQPVLFWPIRP